MDIFNNLFGTSPGGRNVFQAEQNLPMAKSTAESQPVNG